MPKRSKLPRTFLITVSLALSACASSLPKPPKDSLYQPLITKSVVREFEFKNNEWAFKEQHDLKKVHGYFCVSPEYYQKLYEYVIDINSNYSCTKRPDNGH